VLLAKAPVSFIEATVFPTKATVFLGAAAVAESKTTVFLGEATVAVNTAMVLELLQDLRPVAGLGVIENSGIVDFREESRASANRSTAESKVQRTFPKESEASFAGMNGRAARGDWRFAGFARMCEKRAGKPVLRCISQLHAG
jgi:hypothetical protein